jgi:hypothetical protein
MLFKHKREIIHFSGRRHPKTGILAAVTGFLVLTGFLTLSILSGLAKGNGGFFLGVIGILLFILAIAGFVLSYQAFKKKDIFYHFPIVGVILNGFMVILLLIIYILGI